VTENIFSSQLKRRQRVE